MAPIKNQKSTLLNAPPVTILQTQEKPNSQKLKESKAKIVEINKKE